MPTYINQGRKERNHRKLIGGGGWGGGGAIEYQFDITKVGKLGNLTKKTNKSILINDVAGSHK